MATIAEQLTSLANTKTAIKDAIVAKGVTVADDTPFSGYAAKISEISGGGGAPATKYGVSIDSLLGDVDENGTLQRPSVLCEVNLTGVEYIYNYALQYAFYNKQTVINANLSTVVRVGAYGLAYAFVTCSMMESFDLSSLEMIEGAYALSNAFSSCTKIKTANLSSLRRINGQSGLAYAFADCSALTEADFPLLEYVASSGMSCTFRGTKIQKISFPSLIEVESNSFGSASSNGIFTRCTQLTEIHFRADMQATIEAMSQYANKWGATNATIYFDL